MTHEELYKSSLRLTPVEEQELLKTTHTKKIFYTTEKVLVEVFTPDSNIDQPRTVFMEPYMLNGRKILLGVYFDRLYVNLNPA